MNDDAASLTKHDLDTAIDSAVKRVVDDLTGVITDLGKRVDERFTVVESRLDGIDNRLTTVETRLIRIEADVTDVKHAVFELQKSHERLLITIDSFISRIDRYESEQAARDAQFNRLLTWARKVSAQTGIPLEGF